MIEGLDISSSSSTKEHSQVPQNYRKFNIICKRKNSNMEINHMNY